MKFRPIWISKYGMVLLAFIAPDYSTKINRALLGIERDQCYTIIYILYRCIFIKRK